MCLCFAYSRVTTLAEGAGLMQKQGSKEALVVPTDGGHRNSDMLIPGQGTQ